jgi:hypothetical protein
LEIAGLWPMLAALASLIHSAAAVPTARLVPGELEADAGGRPGGPFPKPTPRIAAAATYCTYRNTASYRNTGASFQRWCSEPLAAGWGLSESYETTHANGDTDNADLYRVGPHCFLTFHGADMGYELEGWTSQESHARATTNEFYGVTGVGLSKGLAAELEVILTSIREKYVTLSAWAATCPGRLHVAGHSMGGAMAAMFAYLANLNSDPLDMKKPVSMVFLFVAMPPAEKSLTNDQSSDGCFTGVSYYTRALAGIVPGLGTIADYTPAWPPTMVIPKIASSSIDMQGPGWIDPSNILGTVLDTECGSVPPVFNAMLSNQTLLYGADSQLHWSPENPTALDLHNPQNFVLAFPQNKTGY